MNKFTGCLGVVVLLFSMVTVNGVLVHQNQAIMGPMAHRVIAPYEAHPAKLPLVLQGHGSPVRFRNVWIRPLDR